MTGFETTLRTPHTKNPNVQCILLQKLSIHQTPQCSSSILNSKLKSKHIMQKIKRVWALPARS